ncbi:hypothetical protein [Desulfovibrio sp. Huiquan2017]|uniref:hypothetical protein n=1 Tax=Desulfovibrio sp. Huiquan2017 TaxID=2816861 RepID=UPI001A91FFCC|nr:hypothetical protein [Desulfovibrio sp. Huiquan2017]
MVKDKLNRVAPVIKQLRELSDRPQSPVASGDITHLRYETTRMTYEVSSTSPLPRQCDVKIYYYCLGVRQQQEYDGGDRNRVAISILDILKGCGMSKSRQNYDNVVEALRRYNDLRMRLKYKDASGIAENWFGLFDARIRNRNVELIFSDFYLEALEADDANTHFLALEHIAGLTGLAIQIYSMMQTHLFSATDKVRPYKEKARLITRKLFGEDRGREIPVSSALTHYVKPALERIERETGWRISVKKDGRGEDCVWTFSTAEVPNSFRVAGLTMEEEAKLRDNDEQVAETTATQAAAASTELPDAVIRAIPEKYRADKKLREVLNELLTKTVERNVVVLCESVNTRKVKNFAAVIMGMHNASTLLEQAKKVGANKSLKTFDETLVKRLDAAAYVMDCGEDFFAETCKARGVTPEQVREYVAKKQANDEA